MSNMNDLWSVIMKRIRHNHNLNEPHYYPGTPEDIFIKICTNRLFILEIILHEHRKKYSTIFQPLSGKEALHHMIFTKTHWKPAEIRSLSLADSLFVIDEELQIDKLPECAKSFIEQFEIPENYITAYSLLETDWDPKENSVYLT